MKNNKKMKKIILPIAFMIGTLSSFSQNSNKPYSIGVHFGTTEYLGDMGNEFFSFGEHFTGGISFFKYLSKTFDAGLEGNYGMIDFNDNVSSFETRILDINGLLKIKSNNGKILKENAIISPYIQLGLASALSFANHYIDDMSFDFNFPIGLGIDFKVSKKISINASSRYNYSLTDNYDNRTSNNRNFDDQFLYNSVGLKFNIGKVDTDKDGVIDSEDKCPKVFGLASMNGCPDSDNDGVTDLEDNCPDIAGSLNGCPDSDNDGIIDSKDLCPTIAGLAKFEGCPDSDNDGIIDSKDKCPNIAGLTKFEGCPDSDNDGFIDSKDDCPNLFGKVNGCPDSDNDGIIDSKDKCPEIKALTPSGCPEIKTEDKEVMKRALEGLKFNSGSAVIKTESYKILDEVASVMNSNPTYKLRIEGHTDNTGNPESNLQLSKQRAKAALDYLINKGVSEKRMSSEGYGISKPIADNNTIQGRALNRRVEFILK